MERIRKEKFNFTEIMARHSLQVTHIFLKSLVSSQQGKGKEMGGEGGRIMLCSWEGLERGDFLLHLFTGERNREGDQEEMSNGLMERKLGSGCEERGEKKQEVSKKMPKMILLLLVFQAFVSLPESPMRQRRNTSSQGRDNEEGDSPMRQSERRREDRHCLEDR